MALGTSSRGGGSGMAHKSRDGSVSTPSVVFVPTLASPFACSYTAARATVTMVCQVQRGPGATETDPRGFATASSTRDTTRATRHHVRTQVHRVDMYPLCLPECSALDTRGKWRPLVHKARCVRRWTPWRQPKLPSAGQPTLHILDHRSSYKEHDFPVAPVP